MKSGYEIGKPRGEIEMAFTGIIGNLERKRNAPLHSTEFGKVSAGNFFRKAGNSRQEF